VCNPNGEEIGLVLIPSANLLLVCALDHGSFCGCLSRRHISQETILSGKGSILKPNGAWFGNVEESKLER
jgi:hypothetical protein